MQKSASSYTYLVQQSRKNKDEYVASCLEWELVQTSGKSPTQALQNTQNAVQHLIDDAVEQSKELPKRQKNVKSFFM